MLVWYQLLNLRHLNIVGFFGYVTDVPDGLGLVSSFYAQGNVTHYLSRSPAADKEALVGE